MSDADLLLLRRGGGLWGIATGEVRRLVELGTAVRIELRHGALLADEILGVAPHLSVRPARGVLRRFWPEPCEGVAVHGDSPLVVVDGHHPPSTLRMVEGEAPHGEEQP